MAKLPKVFNTSNVQAEDELIPEGWYVAQITKSEVKPTQSGGKYISLHFKILEGEYAKRIVFANLNIVNQNPTTVKIAEQQLKKICEACGLQEIDDTAELHGIPMQVKVSIQPESAAYPAKNDVKNFKAENAE